MWRGGGGGGEGFLLVYLLSIVLFCLFLLLFSVHVTALLKAYVFMVSCFSHNVMGVVHVFVFCLVISFDVRNEFFLGGNTPPRWPSG